ncbi:MAG: hypothetical protein QOD26_4231 [Betaproteobacteria bacterium]|nr:hypothetical protein [Betaproteobacteria bacterium]
MREPGIILVEDSPYESALAYLALTRKASSVVQVASLRAAARLASGGGAGLAILGRGAITRVSDRQVRALGIPAVAIGAHLTDADDRRALAAGVRAVYRRPGEWAAYLALLGRVLAEWRVTRKDSARRRARTS